MTPRAARILVLEDRAADRLYMTTLLRYKGYTVAESSRGQEALALAEGERVDLVISDVLMPVMDGYEFVRRLRRLAAGVDVPVVFYTATYREREALALAEECGVVDVLIKPSEPEAILARVESVLARGRTRIDPIADDRFAQAHARVTSDTLVHKVRDLEISERRMAAIVKIGQRFVEERDPVTLLNRICETVRDVTLATYALVGLFSEDMQRVTMVLTSGHDERTSEFLRGTSEMPAAVRALGADRRPVRGRNPDGRPEAVNLPPWHPPVHSYMLVPMVSRGRVYGYFGVAEKIGAAEFSEADEIVAITLGVQAGIAYENAVLINELETQAAALRASEAMTDFALEAAGVGIYQRDLITNRVTQSRSMANLFKIREGASISEIYDLMHPDDRESAHRTIDEAIRDRKDFSFDVRGPGEGGKTAYRQMRGRVAVSPRGVPERVLGVVIEMTERRLLEAQLRLAQKMEAIGQLAGGVSHDFNNLLTAILGYARFLSATLEDPEQRGDVAEIIKAGERAAGLTRQLLAFSRRQTQELTVFDLNALIRDLLQMLKRLIGQHVRLTTTLEDPLAPILADRGQIEQVLMNLVVNATDAMPGGGDLRIETANVTTDGVDQVQLVVADTGTGMSDETKARLFEPFFTTKEVGKGTGLGLATVFGIVTQSGGTIAVASAPNEGTTFTVSLPKASSDVGRAPVAAEESIPGGTETVLLVEDEESVRVLARAILERAGYRVLDAGTYSEALRIAESTDFDVLLADVLMPGGTGPELYRALTATRPALRVLYTSGYAQDTILDVRQLAATAAFLPKPFTEASLAHKLREVLDR